MLSASVVTPDRWVDVSGSPKRVEGVNGKRTIGPDDNWLTSHRSRKCPIRESFLDDHQVIQVRLDLREKIDHESRFAATRHAKNA